MCIGEKRYEKDGGISIIPFIKYTTFPVVTVKSAGGLKKMHRDVNKCLVVLKRIEIITNGWGLIATFDLSIQPVDFGANFKNLK